MAVCVTISSKTIEECVTAAATASGILSEAGISPAIELRGDLCHMSPKMLADVVRRVNALPSAPPVILTWRNDTGDFLKKTLTFTPSGTVGYIDVGIETSRLQSDELRSTIHRLGGRFISSFHDFGGTPCIDELEEICGICLGRGADIIKTVTTAHTLENASVILELYRRFKDTPLCAFAMGDAGRITRRLCLEAGAPFTYCAPDAANIAAPGQYTVKEAAEWFSRKKFPHKMPSAKEFAEKATSVTVPSSKSIAQRAIIAAALAAGESHLKDLSTCEDTEAALRAAEQFLGCAATNVDAGESALLSRILLPLSSLRATEDNPITVTGHGNLLTRNLKSAADALRNCGINIECDEVNGEIHLPITVKSGITVNDIHISGADGSQIVTGLLMTLPLLPEESSLTVHEPASIPYINLTIELLRQFGIEIGRTDSVLNGRLSSITFRVRGGQKYHPAEITLEPDWSSAAYLLAARSIAESRGLPGFPTPADMPAHTLQADEKIREIIGGNWTEGFETDATDCPDLIPLLAVLGCFSRRRCSITGIHRLHHKESDRAEAIFSELSSLGAHITVKEDSMTIHPDGHLHGGFVHSHHDHRIAMSTTVAAMFIEEPVFIDDISCIRKSFPDFTKLLQESGGGCCSNP